MKKRMQNIISLVLIFVSIFSLSAPAIAREDKDVLEKGLHISAMPVSDDANEQAYGHLLTMKSVLETNSEQFGFSADELSGMELGSPFTIYVFDNNAQLLSDDGHIYPLIYMDEIIGTLESHFDTESGSYNFSFGDANGKEYNALLNDAMFEANTQLIIGRVASKLFATDGQNLKTIVDDPTEHDTALLRTQIENSCSTYVSAANSNYNNITQIISYSLPYAGVQPKALPQAILGVPHVAQTSVCGAAAWAAVLNYRFNKYFTNDSLESSMKCGGYTSGDTFSMMNYRDYANDKYDAGCIFSYDNPTFTSLKASIAAHKPILGSWSSGLGSNKEYHAIIIAGYVELNSSKYTYYVKNPWHPNLQTSTVTDHNNVVYYDGGYSWKLLNVTY